MALLGDKIKPAAHGEGDLWIVSYADMMTLLFGFFVILYSLSQVDEKRLTAVGKQLAETFGHKKSVVSDSVVTLEERELRALQLLISALNLGDNVEEALDKIEKGAADSANLHALGALLSTDIQEKSDSPISGLGASTIQAGDRIEIVLPDNMLFTSGSADLTPRAKKTIAHIANLISRVNGLLGIEVVGHTDSTPASKNAPFPNNWALSSARAGAVAESLIQSGVNPKEVLTRGMASLEPLFPEKAADGSPLPVNMAKNRRVHIIVKKARHGDESHQ
jgi:chemotaxis protein MotB